MILSLDEITVWNAMNIKAFLIGQLNVAAAHKNCIEKNHPHTLPNKKSSAQPDNVMQATEQQKNVLSHKQQWM